MRWQQNHCMVFDSFRSVLFLFHTGYPVRNHDAVYSSKPCYFLNFLWLIANSGIDWWRPLMEEGLHGKLRIYLQKIMCAGCVKLLGFDVNLWRNVSFFVGSYEIGTKVRYATCDEYILGSKNWCRWPYLTSNWSLNRAEYSLIGWDGRLMVAFLWVYEFISDFVLTKTVFWGGGNTYFYYV